VLHSKHGAARGLKIGVEKMITDGCGARVSMPTSSILILGYQPLENPLMFYQSMNQKS
jgi:hypothetical protein